MGWISIGLKVLPYITGAVHAVEQFVSAKGKAKEDAAVNMVAGVLQAVEGGSDKDLLNDADVNQATREVMQAVVALENLIAQKRAAS
jgi:hypothetical protein